MRYMFTRDAGTVNERREFGFFNSAEAAGRYARSEGFTNYREDGALTATEFDPLDKVPADAFGQYEAVVSAPEVPGLAFGDLFAEPLAHPGMAVEDAFAFGPTPEAGWEALAVAEGNTSDISDAYVAPNVNLYSVTRTLEITVPVYAADKASAIDAIKGESSTALILNSGAVTKVFATTARVRAHV